MERCIPGWRSLRAAPARSAIAWLAACLLLVHGGLARAEDDLPGRVGRLSDASGGVLVASEYAGNEWLDAGINHPITSGDSLWSPVGGRAEVDYGGGQFRIAGATHVQVARLDERELALFVAEGTLVIRVRFLDPEDVVSLEAPTSQVRIVRPGLYRIDVLPDRQATIVTVRDGEAIVTLAGDALQALPGQTVTIAGQDPAVAELRNGVAVDGFDTWSADRDRYYERGRSATYVSRQMVGVAELDEYGTWQTYPDYGAVWFPNSVPVDWAPYRDGSWIAVGGWGPTWVDAAPWGYAPFHYGRWARIGGRWGWCPGGYVARPQWAPALVAWYGGPGWSVSASGGAPVYAWVPLGWRDPYLPPWRGCSQRCWTRFNHPYGVATRERPRTIPAHWENQRVPGALTAVPAGALAGSRSIGREHLQLPPESAASAPALPAGPALAPGRDGRPPSGTATAGSPAGTRVPPAPGSSYRAMRPIGDSTTRSERSPSGTSPSVAVPSTGPSPRGTAPAAPTAVPDTRGYPPRTSGITVPSTANRTLPPPKPPPAPRSGGVPVAPAPAGAPAVPAPTAAKGHSAPATGAPAAGAVPLARQERGIPMPAATAPSTVPAQPGGARPSMPQVALPPPGMPAVQGVAPMPGAPQVAPVQPPGRAGQRDGPSGGVAPSAPSAPVPGAIAPAGAPAPR